MTYTNSYRVTTDYIIICVMNDCDNVCPYKVNSILAKSAKFIFQCQEIHAAFLPVS